MTLLSGERAMVSRQFPSNCHKSPAQAVIRLSISLEGERSLQDGV